VLYTLARGKCPEYEVTCYSTAESMREPIRPDPAREKDYNAKAQQMDSRSASDSFGKTAQALLDGRYKDVLK